METHELIAKLHDLDMLAHEPAEFRAVFLGRLVSRTALYTIRVNEIEIAFPGMKVVCVDVDDYTTHALIIDHTASLAGGRY